MDELLPGSSKLGPFNGKVSLSGHSKPIQKRKLLYINCTTQSRNQSTSLSHSPGRSGRLRIVPEESILDNKGLPESYPV